MSAARNLDDLPPDVRKEIELLAMQVTQGFPAFRSLKSVLTEDEWRQIEAELERYFPPPKTKEDTGTAEPKTGDSPQATIASTPEAASPASEPAVSNPVRPQHYAIKTLMKLRKMSQCRAILELAMATDLLSNARYRGLLHEIGEQEEPPPAALQPEWDKKVSELRLGGKVLKRLRGASVAKNVVQILDAFQEQGWPRHTLDPLPGGRNQKRLHDTILSLNEDLEGLRFRADGTGEGICWDLIPPP
jgi:hypothetical protein